MAGYHNGCIGHHVVLAEEAAHRGQHLGGGGVGPSAHVLKRLLGGVGPVPGVVEGLDLRGALVAGGAAEEHVIAGVRVEGRVEIDEVDGAARDALAQDVQVIAVVEVVHGEPPREWSGEDPRDAAEGQGDLAVRVSPAWTDRSGLCGVGRASSGGPRVVSALDRRGTSWR